MDQELVNTKKCVHCDSECDVNAKYCGVCGTVFESKENEEFGNGKSLKFFNFIYTPVLVISIILLVFLILSFFMNLQTYYYSDFGAYLSFNVNRFELLTIIINIIYIVLLVNTRIKDNKIGYSKLIIYMLVLRFLVTVISTLLVYFELGAEYINVTTTLTTMATQVGIGIAVYLYLIKLFDFKWFDFSDIL